MHANPLSCETSIIGLNITRLEKYQDQCFRQDFIHGHFDFHPFNILETIEKAVAIHNVLLLEN